MHTQQVFLAHLVSQVPAVAAAADLEISAATLDLLEPVEAAVAVKAEAEEAEPMAVSVDLVLSY